MILSAVGDLTLSGSTTKTAKVESTGNGTNGIVDVIGKTGGAVPVQIRLIADGANSTCGLVVVSNHGWDIKTNNLSRMQISAGGRLTLMPVGFESAQQTITANSLLTLAHGLGAIPKEVWVVLKCITGEGGFVAGDEIAMPIQALRNELEEHGIGWSADTTNIYVAIGDNIIVYRRSATVGTEVALTNGNFRIIARANP